MPRNLKFTPTVDTAKIFESNIKETFNSVKYDKQKDFKMGIKLEQTLLQRRY
jgi:hypothetical protein